MAGRSERRDGRHFGDCVKARGATTLLDLVGSNLSLIEVTCVAGGNSHQAPAQYFRLDSTEALVMELVNCADMHITPIQAKRGNGG